jgi:hypothetical protein
MESYDYRADYPGIWTWPKQWLLLRAVQLQTDATKPVEIKLVDLLTKAFNFLG